LQRPRLRCYTATSATDVPRDRRSAATNRSSRPASWSRRRAASTCVSMATGRALRGVNRPGLGHEGGVVTASPPASVRIHRIIQSGHW